MGELGFTCHQMTIPLAVGHRGVAATPTPLVSETPTPSTTSSGLRTIQSLSRASTAHVRLLADAHGGVVRRTPPRCR